MAEALAVLSSSLSSLSLAPSHRASSVGGLKLPSKCFVLVARKSPPLLSLRAPSLSVSVSASASATALEEERSKIEKFVKQAMPGGIAAQRLLGTGRRKTAVARVCLLEGTGQFVINNRTLQDYLQGNPLWIQTVKFPLTSLGYDKKYDVIVKAHGGGLSAQAQATLLGIARALCVANLANRDPLKKQGLLTRDSRKVERKKYGLKKARKAPQFSKR